MARLRVRLVVACKVMHAHSSVELANLPSLYRCAHRRGEACSKRIFTFLSGLYAEAQSLLAVKPGLR